MALTKVSTDGVKDDAITKTKIPANQIEASELADNAVDTNAIADQAVALSKLPHGTSSNDGKFLRANNGADPTFETVTSTTINNNADNRVITGSGTANTLEGEANLTFDGDELQIHHATDPEIHLNINTHGDVGQIKGDADGLHLTGNGSSNQIRLKTNNTERLRIQSNGDVYLNPTQGSTGVNSGAIRRFNAGLDYWSGTAGSANAIKYAAHGQSDDNMYGMGISNSLLELQSQVDIGFFAGSAGSGTGRRVERARITSNGLTFNGDTAAANALDDYEEGTWTPTTSNTGGNGFQTIHSATYTKIGNVVYIQFYATFNSQSSSARADIGGLPFQARGNDIYGYLKGRLQGHAGAELVLQIGGGVSYGRFFYNNADLYYSNVSGYYCLLSGFYYTDS